MIKQIELESGSVLLADTVKHTDIISVGFWFRHGSINEAYEQKGYAHFIEHILFKGTDKRSTSDIARSFDKIGSNINAFTEKDVTCFYCTFPSRHLYYALDILLDMIFNPLFEKSEIEKEKNVIISEIGEYEDNPEDNSYDIFMEKMWPDCSLGWKITGDIENIETISRNSLYNYYLENYTNKNLVISVSGCIDNDEITDYLNKTIPLNNKSDSLKGEFEHRKKYSFDIIPEETRQVQIYTGIDIKTPSKMETYYHFLIFSTMAGESMSSRFYQKLREESGLCYSVYSFRSFFSDISMWNIYANTIPENTEKLLEKLLKELHLIYSRKFSFEELEDAKTHLEGGLILAKEDMELRMKRSARHFLLSGNTPDYNESLEILRNVTENDINSFINNNLDCGPFNTLIYGNDINNSIRNLKIGFTEF